MVKHTTNITVTSLPVYNSETGLSHVICMKSVFYKLAVNIGPSCVWKTDILSGELAFDCGHGNDQEYAMKKERVRHNEYS